VKTTSTHEPATTAQVKTQPREATSEVPLIWTWFIDNPPADQPGADQADTRFITPSNEGGACPRPREHQILQPLRSERSRRTLRVSGQSTPHHMNHTQNSDYHSRSRRDSSPAESYRLPQSRSWFRGPTAALLLPYLLMVLGAACILELELHGSADNAPSEPQHIPTDLVPAAVQTSFNSSPAGGALTRDE
jgi:hypothetical protein